MSFLHQAYRGVVPLDPAAEGDMVRVGDERTPRDVDLPSTEPERSPEEFARYLGREAATPAIDKAGLLRAPEKVVLGDEHEMITRPDKSTGSDVFASMRPEQPTPLERPGKARPDDVDTLAQPPLVAQEGPMVTLHVRPEAQEIERPRHERETARERAVIESVYHTHRSFLDMQQQDPQRAAFIASQQQTLRAREMLDDRDLAIATHDREKRELVDAPAIDRRAREDRVYALGLLARELDDRYREQTRALKAKLMDDVRALPSEKRDAVFEDFDSFAQTGPASDSNFCRRELHKALREEEVLHKAYVYALALDKKSDPKRVEADAATLLSDASDPRSVG